MEKITKHQPIALTASAHSYHEHFGIRDLPFRNIPDTDYYFSSESGRDVMNNLVFAMQSGETLIKVTGEVGTGKTMLCHRIMDSLDDTYDAVYIPNPYRERSTLIHAIGDELRQGCESNAALFLCFDEAQGMTPETLEVIRLIGNLGCEYDRAIHVVLVGQPELDVMLDDPSLRNLKQRIAFSCTLEPITYNEMEHYVAHRLTVAGYDGDPLFSEKALQRLFKTSRGIPRLINILTHKAMMAAFGEGSRLISGSHIKAAVNDTDSTRSPSMMVKSLASFCNIGL